MRPFISSCLLLLPLAMGCSSTGTASRGGGGSQPDAGAPGAAGDESMAAGSGGESGGIGPDSDAGAAGEGGSATNAGASGVGGTPTPSVYSSGSRLRARVLTAEGGAKVMTGVHDKLLDVDCTLSKDPTGKRYCMPNGDAVAYTDAGCTMPIVLHVACEGPPKYARTVVDERKPCGEYDPTVSVYRVAASQGPISHFYTASVNGTCDEANVANLYEGYALGSAVDTASMAAIDESLEPAAPGLLGHVMASRDGFRVVDAVYDAATRQQCNLLLSDNSASQTARCHVGNEATSDNYGGPFGDASCSAQATYVSGNCGATPDIVSMITLSTTCGPTQRSFHTLGKKLDAGFNGPPLKCSAGNASGDYYAVGGVADLSALPLLSASLQGTGTHHNAIWKSGGVPVMALYDYLVDDQAMRCNIARFPDGSLRCIDESTRISSTTDQLQFSDAACTQRVLAQYFANNCPPPAIAGVVSSESNYCGSSAKEAFKLGAPVMQSMYWTREPDKTDCTQVNDPSVLYPYGAQQDVTAFGEVQDVVE